MARGWFLRIALSVNVSMHVCVCVCVCVFARKAIITSGMM